MKTISSPPVLPVVPVVLVGYGYAGRVFHAPLIRRTPGMQLVAVVSSSAAKVQAELGAMAVFSDLQAALAAVPPGALVVIAAPNALHAPLAQLALQAGHPVVLDKPFTVTLAEARALQADADARGLLLSIFHNRRWDGDYLTLHTLIRQQTLGRVHLLASRFDRYRPEVRQRWREQHVPGGGLWFDLGSHLIDQALCLFGLPEGVQAQIRRVRPGAQIDDQFEATLHYPDVMVQLGASMLLAGGLPRFSVHGSLGSWVKTGLDDQEARLLGQAEPLQTAVHFGSDGQCGARPIEPGDYAQFYRAVAAALMHGEAPPVPASEAIAVMAVLEAGMLATNSGRIERLALTPAESDRFERSRQTWTGALSSGSAPWSAGRSKRPSKDRR